MANKNEQFLDYAFQTTKHSINKLKGHPLPCCYQIITEHSAIEIPKGAELVSMFGGEKVEGTFYEMDATNLNGDLVDKQPSEWTDIIKNKLSEDGSPLGYTLWGLVELENIELYRMDNSKSSVEGVNLFLIMHQIGEEPQCILMKDGWNMKPSEASRLEPKLMSSLLGWSEFPV